MTVWNPNLPKIIGPEWLPTRRRWAPLSRTWGQGAVVTVNDVGAIDAIWAFLRFDRGPTNAVTINVELYDNAAAAAAANPAPLASGSLAMTGLVSQAAAWKRIPLTAAYTPSPGQKLLVVLRLADTRYTLSWATLDATTTIGHEADRLAGQESVEVPLSSTNFRPTVSYAYPQLDPGARAICLGHSPTTLSTDSQPYSEVRSRTVHDTSTTVHQTILGAAMDYGAVWCLVQNTPAVQNAQPLIVTITDSTGAVLAQTSMGTVLRPDALNGPMLSNPPDLRWYPRGAFLDPAITFADGATYTITYSSISPESAPWTLATLATNSGSGGIAAMDALGLPGQGASATEDVLTWLDESIEPVTNVTVGTQILDTSRGLVNCVVPTMEIAAVTWDPHPRGTEIVRYEIERNDDGVWWPVGAVVRSTDHDPVFRPPGGPTSFFDLEALRNTPVTYRVRAVCDCGTMSSWTIAAPIVLHSDDTDVILASNARYDLTWVGEDEPGYTWDPVDGQRLAARMLYQQDKQVAFREAEFRGDSFSRSLIVAFDDPNMTHIPPIPQPPIWGGQAGTITYTPPGRAAFDSLLAIAHNRDVPYIVFLDGRARRWYTAPAVQHLHEDQPQQSYKADVAFIEVSDRPFPSSLPYLTSPPSTDSGWDYDTWDTDTWSAV